MKSKFFFLLFCIVLLLTHISSCSKYDSGLDRIGKDLGYRDTIHYQLGSYSIDFPKSVFPNGQWVLVDIPCKHYSQLLSLRFGSAIVDRDSDTLLAICIGRFNETKRIITKPKVYYISITSANSEYSKDEQVLTVDVSSISITIDEGEIVALYGYYNTNIKLLNVSISSGRCFISPEAPYFLPKSVFSECNDFSCFEYTVAELPNEKANSINDNNKNTNFTIQSYSRVAFIGTSYVRHAYIPDWKVEKPRSMAASVDETDFTYMILERLKYTNPNLISTFIPDGAWQTSYDGFDYEGYFGASLENSNPDIIFLVTAGNSTFSPTFEGSFEFFLKYLKSKCPDAKIIVLVGWYTTQKRDAMINACYKQSIDFVDLIDINEASMRWRLGDWYVGIKGDGDNNDLGYYCFSSTKVVGLHANDLGFCIAAHRCLQKAEAGGCLDLIHNISINTNGFGSVSCPNYQWVSGGLVSLRIDQGIVDNIEVRDATDCRIEIIKLSNDYSGTEKEYYLFIMPDSDVEVNVSFIS